MVAVSLLPTANGANSATCANISKSACRANSVPKGGAEGLVVRFHDDAVSQDGVISGNG